MRCATYPDKEQFDADRDDIEKRWPAFADDTSLPRAPAYAWRALRPSVVPHIQTGVARETWHAEGALWLQLRLQRLQHVLSH